MELLFTCVSSSQTDRNLLFFIIYFILLYYYYFIFYYYLFTFLLFFPNFIVWSVQGNTAVFTGTLKSVTKFS
jgi:hypothetical protein